MHSLSFLFLVGSVLVVTNGPGCYCCVSASSSSSSCGGVVAAAAFWNVPPTTGSRRFSSSSKPKPRQWQQQQQQQQQRQRHVGRFSLQEKLSSEDIRLRLANALEALREKDRTKSKSVTAENLNVVYQDDYLIVVEKPSGVLTVPTGEGVPSLAQVVHDAYCSDHDMNDTSSSSSSSPVVIKPTMHQMVVHRLGMDTSGLVVFAKTMEAVRGMNVLFRNRKITRQYQALLCGHLTDNHRIVAMPLMRDYEYPPYMRISSDEHQSRLVDLDPDIVGKKLLEAPKSSWTHYKVLNREYLHGDEKLPVTRVILTSVTGRTHQLNVHSAAIGHPIVKDTVYGYNGQAAPNGGLKESDLPPDAASKELQEQIAKAAANMNMCVHASLIRFRHPITKEEMEFTSPPPF